MTKQQRAKSFILKLLKKSGRQFYDPKTGKKITPEQFVEIVLKQKVNELNAFKAEIQRRRKK